MSHRPTFRAVVFPLLAVAVLALVPPVAAQTTPEKYLELLRSDIRASKVEILTEALALTDAQGQAFWPIYREYDTAMSALGDRRVALIKTFAASYGSTTDDQAATMAKEFFSIQEERIKLRRKYHAKVEKAVSSLVAARFIQVETVLGNLLDLQLGAELPLLE